MSRLAARIYDRWFAPKRPRTQKRRYAAAKSDRLNSNWTVTPYTANYILRQDLYRLRARARQMCRDAPHFAGFLGTVRTNVIGARGMRCQVRARLADGSLNLDLNKRVEEAFWYWGHRQNCSVTGKLDWIAAQRLFVTQLARDGEVLVQKVAANNPYGFSLKFWDVDYLDEMYNEELPDGGRIIMSVEIDANGTPVAYWLTTPPSDVQFAKRRERHRTRVPADQMIHAFLVTDDESQVRGVTWFHASLLKGRNLDVYTGAVEDAVKMQAMSGGFFSKTNPDGDDKQWDGQEDDEGNPMWPEIDFQPGSFHILPNGYKFDQFDPKQPSQNHAEFVRETLAHMAAGVGLPYFELTGDLSNVNYSSARIGQMASRDLWRALHQFVETVFCIPVYHAWLQSAVMNGALKLKQSEFKEVMFPQFRGRGWQYTDPLKEVQADSLALLNNIATLTDTLAEQGIDLVDHFETIRAERALAKSYGIDLVYVTKVTATDTPDAKAGEGDSTGTDSGKSTPKRELTNGHGLEYLGDEVA
jgi:lambda family phage portal protein